MYLKVIVKTGAKKESFVEISQDHYEISVKEKPERNMANLRIRELISEKLLVSVSKVRIINGHRHPHKLLFVDEK